MHTAPPMHDVRIIGFGSYLPAVMHSNATLPPLDEPVTPADLERIGVHRRGWAGDGESIAEMAALASHRALARAGVSAAELDVVIVANWTRRRYLPEFAPSVKLLIGAQRAFAHDLGCACAGFLYGLGTASELLRNPRYRRVLVVASEQTSQRARPGSRGTLILGDGAGAFVLERADDRDPGGGRLIDYELDCDGAHAAIMEITDDGWVHTHIAQRELCTLAARSIADVAGRLLARNRLTLADVRWVIPHSGTAGVQAAIVRALDLPASRVLTNYADVGNVSSASIPVALDHFVATGQVRPGNLVLSAAVGGGWYSAAALYTVGEVGPVRQIAPVREPGAGAAMGAAVGAAAVGAAAVGVAAVGAAAVGVAAVEAAAVGAAAVGAAVVGVAAVGAAAVGAAAQAAAPPVAEALR
jgi:3-oxoacyl-[acyl-carrier-protein] synthase III